MAATATLIAAAVALYAAYRTLKPITEQLNQLIKQNDHSLHDRLRARAANLNTEEMLIYQVTSGCEVVSRALAEFLKPYTFGETAGLEVAVDRLAGFVEKLQVQRGEVWGDAATQELRREFVDLALGCGSLAISILKLARSTNTFGARSQEVTNWSRLRDEIHIRGERLFALVTIESKRIGEAITTTEKRLFEDPGDA